MRTHSRYGPLLDPEEAKRRRRKRSKAWKDAHPEQMKAYRRSRYAADTEAQKAKVAAWYEKNKTYALAKSAIRQLARFGLTLDSFKELLENQKGRCAICGDAPVKGGRRFSIDHDHKTLEIRGILCHRCNVGLGQFRENAELLLRATNYLKCARTGLRLPRPLDQNPGRRKTS